jgi:hypothetical protein
MSTAMKVLHTVDQEGLGLYRVGDVSALLLGVGYLKNPAECHCLLAWG